MNDFISYSWLIFVLISVLHRYQILVRILSLLNIVSMGNSAIAGPSRNFPFILSPITDWKFEGVGW